MGLRVAFATVPMLAGLAALLGWVTGVEPLTNLLAGLPTMKPLTALALVIAGAGLALLPNKRDRHADVSLRAATIAGLVVALIGTLSIIFTSTGWQSGADLISLGFAPTGDRPDRWTMAPATAFNLVVAGTAIVVLALRQPPRALIFSAHVGAVLISLIALFTLVIYFQNVEALRLLPAFESMSVLTVVAFGSVAAALLMTVPLNGWLGYIANVPARKALAIVAPLTVAIPLAAGMGAILTLHAGWIALDLAIPLVVSLTGFLVLALVWFAALLVGRAEAAIVDRGDAHAERARRADADTMRAAELLHHGQKMQILGELVGRVGHDFNNYLTVIRGSSDALARGKLSEEKRQRHLVAIGKSAIHAGDLVGRLMSFSHVRPIRLEVVDLSHLVVNIVDILAYSLGNGIKLKTRISPDLWPVKIDPNQLEVALLNVGLNARDAMGGVGTLSIEVENSTADSEEFVCLRVSDTGAGMPPEVLARAAEPFFTTKPDGRGTGLGLAQVHEFVANVGGQLRAESVEGQGTTFIFCLPRCEGEDGSFFHDRLTEFHHVDGTV